MDHAWKTFRFLEAEPTARKFLTACYEGIELEHADRLAFQNSTRFLYFWKQARQYYRTAETAELSVRPLLLFYGSAHLLKGMLLTRDPAYPQNSRVLQHGVTTRKLKRSTYSLIEDEIRPQKEGFFAHLAHVFELSPLQDRYVVRELVTSMPGVSQTIALLTHAQPLWLRLKLNSCIHSPSADSADGHSMGSCESWMSIVFPEKQDGPLAYSCDTFAQYIRRLAPAGWHGERLQRLHWKKGTDKELLLPHSALSTLEQHPLFRVLGDELFFWNGSANTLPLPEWASHYLLLYLLSMLCRYETEWWGEITFTHDYAERVLLEEFLEYHIESFPTVIMRQVQQKNSLYALP